QRDAATGQGHVNQRYVLILYVLSGSTVIGALCEDQEQAHPIRLLWCFIYAYYADMIRHIWRIVKYEIDGSM
ncbi:MAG: hypothetical protein ACXVCM_14780, partial [Ktedonobacteraceae bacterium]